MMAESDLSAGDGVDAVLATLSLDIQCDTPHSLPSYQTMNEQWNVLIESVEYLKSALWLTRLPETAMFEHEEAKTCVILLAMELARVINNVRHLLNDVFIAGEDGSRREGECTTDQDALCDSLHRGDVQRYEVFQKSLRLRLRELQQALASFNTDSDSSRVMKTKAALSSLMTKIPISGTDVDTTGPDDASLKTSFSFPCAILCWSKLAAVVTGESAKESTYLNYSSMYEGIRRNKDILPTGLASIEHLLLAFDFLDQPFAEQQDRARLQEALRRTWSNLDAMWKYVQGNSLSIDRSIRCLKKIPDMCS
eukprot:scpid80952/ scgid20835/ 